MILGCYSHNPLQCNQYILVDGKNALMIDASSPLNSDMIGQLKGVNHILMLYTHSHFDHIAYGQQQRDFFENQGATVESKASILEKEMYGLEGCTVLQGALSYFQVEDFYTNVTPPTIDCFISNDGEIGFGDFNLTLTPGHSRGGVIIYSNSRKILFTGDTLFTGGSFGRVDLPGGSYRDLRQSLVKIFLMDDSYTIYPGHGSSGSLLEEKKIF